MSTLMIYFLGPPRIVRDNSPLHIGRRKALALLIYLAVTGQPHARDSLAALLWPEHDAGSARGELRRCISALSKTLGGRCLLSDRDRVALAPGPDLWLDVTEFQRLLASCTAHGHPPAAVCQDCLGPLKEAVDLGRGDFLAGFTLADSPDFDTWQGFETESLRLALVEALDRLVQVYLSGAVDAAESAIPYARRRVALDPLHEPAHCRLMALYARTGRRAEALRQYRDCVAILQQELGLPPSEETTGLYQRIVSADELGADKSPGASPYVTPAASTQRPGGLAHNLPLALTSFVGRQAELNDITALLVTPDCRLLTLVGPGGIGKTRLALEAAHQLTDQAESAFAEGIYFVDLAPVRTPDLLAGAILNDLPVAREGIADPEDQLRSTIADWDLLLVLDNFEHLLDGAGLFTLLLQSAPGLKLLVTSRERLNLQAETVYVVDGMAFPQDSDELNVEHYAAVQLFVQRAQRAEPSFTLSTENRSCLARVCRLVQGIPLAIELAAVWVRVLSCDALFATIAHNLDFLSSTSHDLPLRHRSLRAVFEHSWRLLSRAEQDAFARLAVFPGGFELQAAAHVATAHLSVLTALLDKSLVRRTGRGRFELHEVLRHYAVGKLAETTVAEDVHARHCTYYAAFLHDRTAALKGSRQKLSLQEIEVEIDNIHAAWGWAMTHGRAEDIDRLLDGLYHFYRILPGRGAIHTFRRTADALVYFGATGNDVLVAKIKVRLGHFYQFLGLQHEAREMLQTSVASLRRLQEHHELAFALVRLSHVENRLGDYDEATARAGESLALYQAARDSWGTAYALESLGLILLNQEDYDGASQRFMESLALFHEIGDLYDQAQCTRHLGLAAYAAGSHAEAKARLLGALSLYRGLNSRLMTVDIYHYLGLIARHLGRPVEAQQFTQEGFRVLTGETTSDYEAVLADIRAALDSARAGQSLPRTLTAVITLVEKALLPRHEIETAGELAAFVLEHATDKATRYRAQQILGGLETQMPPHALTAARARARRRDPARIVTELLATVSV